MFQIKTGIFIRKRTILGFLFREKLLNFCNIFTVSKYFYRSSLPHFLPKTTRLYTSVYERLLMRKGYFLPQFYSMIHSILKSCPSAGNKSPQEIDALRERLTSFSILVALIAGLPIISLKAYQSVRQGYDLAYWPPMLVYSFLALFAIFRKRIDYRVRASVSIALMFLTVFFGLHRFGFVEAAFIASLSSSVFSIVILGRKTGILFALFMCGVGMTVVFILSSNMIDVRMDSTQAIELIFRWWPQLFAIFSFYFSLAVSIGMIEGVLIQTLKETESRKDELELLNEQLLESKELAERANYTKSQFMSVMSHELKTPLNPILGLINLLKEEPLDPNCREYLDLMEASTLEMLSLINQILDYINTDRYNITPNLQPIHIKEFCENLTKMHRMDAEQKGLDLRLDFNYETPNRPDSDIEIINDPNRLTQILSNLLANSIKFTNHGQVVLSVHNHTGSGQPDDIEFVISDTGIGISQNVLDQVFEPFVQGFHANTRSYSGVGLGLSMVNKLCVLLNGSLQVHSVEGEGTEFRIQLPCDISA